MFFLPFVVVFALLAFEVVLSLCAFRSKEWHCYDPFKDTSKGTNSTKRQPMWRE